MVNKSENEEMSKNPFISFFFKSDNYKNIFYAEQK